MLSFWSYPSPFLKIYVRRFQPLKQRMFIYSCHSIIKIHFMRPYILSLGTIMILVATVSCKKTVENSGLIGKWKLIERYNGYFNGGNFQWNRVPPQNSHTLTFTSDGKYTKKEGTSSTQNNCIGTYILHSDNKLEINSNCNTGTERAVVSDLTSKKLILDRSGIEGVIRYKYSSTN